MLFELYNPPEHANSTISLTHLQYIPWKKSVWALKFAERDIIGTNFPIAGPCNLERRDLHYAT
jgi:hypothetical protein